MGFGGVETLKSDPKSQHSTLLADTPLPDLRPTGPIRPGRARTSSRPSVHDCDRSYAVSHRAWTGTGHALHQPGTGRRHTRLPVTIPASRELARCRWTGRKGVRGGSPSRRLWATSAPPWFTVPTGHALGRVLRPPRPSPPAPRPERRLHPPPPPPRQSSRQTSSIGSPCKPARPPAAAPPPANSLPAAIGKMPAVLAVQIAPFIDETRLWREQSGARSAAFGRGSGEATHAGKEGLACGLMMAGPSSILAGARDGRSPGSDESRSRPFPPPPVLDASRMVPAAVR